VCESGDVKLSEEEIPKNKRILQKEKKVLIDFHLTLKKSSRKFFFKSMIFFQ